MFSIRLKKNCREEIMKEKKSDKIQEKELESFLFSVSVESEIQCPFNLMPENGHMEEDVIYTEQFYIFHTR